MVHFKQESDPDGNRRYMCYRITLYNVQCQDNVTIVFNNIILYKIFINKRIITITYVTTSMPSLPDLVWFNNTVIIQYTAYSIHWQWVQCIFDQYNTWVRKKAASPDTRYMCASLFCSQWLASCLSTLGHKWNTCSPQLRYIHAGINVALEKYIVNSCNNTLLY